MLTLPENARIIVVGASGAIGRALIEHLSEHYPSAEIFGLSRRDVSSELPACVQWLPMDLESEASIASAAESICESGPVHAVLVATGLLHEGKDFRPEKAIRQLSGENLERSFRINAVGPALVGKHFLPRFPKRERGYFAALSARVGSISDNRVGGWYGYRASKAALNMFLKNFSIEAKRSHPELIIAGLQPGTVDSALSRPFQGSAHHVLEPEESAQGLLEALNSLETSQSGILIDWKGVSFEP
ncbi:MAG: SDR family NAD(P)-dependent oxidoreductase [Myxococcota bacterium]|nr:SDR family NAD(P)-dependent oxidoreductase [Myxococcota bacterium]